jgi:hypothetical protein
MWPRVWLVFTCLALGGEDHHQIAHGEQPSLAGRAAAMQMQLTLSNR